MDDQKHLSLPSGTGDAILSTTVKTLEASKDVITSVTPVPGLGIALNLTIEILKKIQVRDESPFAASDTHSQPSCVGGKVELLGLRVTV